MSNQLVVSRLLKLPVNPTICGEQSLKDNNNCRAQCTSASSTIHSSSRRSPLKKKASISRPWMSCARYVSHVLYDCPHGKSIVEANVMLYPRLFCNTSMSAIA